MKVLLDLNVVLDVILNRQPFLADSLAEAPAESLPAALPPSPLPPFPLPETEVAVLFPSSV